MLTKFIPFEFERAVPESVGVDSEAIARFEAKLREMNSRHQGYMIYKDGKLAASSIAAPYRVTDKRHVYSVSKTWTSTAIGIAVFEGLLSVEDTVISFFPDLLPDTVCENLAKMKVKHLLSMNTGHKSDTFPRVATAEPGWAKRFLSLDVEFEPGTHFCYNTTATYMLSAILTRLTGMRMTDYLRPRLFNPLGIEGVWWDESPEGIDFGGWGIHVSAEDMLKLGVLYLNKGVWNGMRILPEEWISEATSAVSDNSANKEVDWAVGYGYQIWRCQHNCYRADGAFGQYIIVSPDKNCVAVLISELGGILGGTMQDLLDLYWDTVFAGMSDEPLPIKGEFDTSAHPFMCLPVGAGDAAERNVKLDANKFGIKALRAEPTDNGLALTLWGDGDYACQLMCGFGQWEYNRVRHLPIRPTPGQLDDGELNGPGVIAAAYGEKDGKLTVKLAFVSSPHGMTLTVGDTAVSVESTMPSAPVEVAVLR